MVIRKRTQFFMSTKEPNEEEESRVSSVNDNSDASQSQRSENAMGEDLVEPRKGGVECPKRGKRRNAMTAFWMTASRGEVRGQEERAS